MNTKPIRNYLMAVLAAVTLSSALPAVSHAQDAAAPATTKWETSAAAGLTLTRGNSDTLLATLSLDTTRKWEKDEALAGVSGGYGENEGARNAEFIKGYGQYNHLFTERFYGGLRVDAAYDGIADLDYRGTLSPLVGYYVIKTTNTSLAFEAGPSVVIEKYRNQSSDVYLGARFAERFEHKLTASTKIWQSLEYLPRVDRWAEDYLVTAEIGIDTAITAQWSLRVVGQDVYDSEPAPGRKKNDLRLIAGTAYKF